MVASRNDAAATGLLVVPVAQPYDSIPPAASPFLAPPPYFVTPPLPSEDHGWDPTWYKVRTAVLVQLYLDDNIAARERHRVLEARACSQHA